MKIIIQSKNLDVTPTIHDYVEQKVTKTVGHFPSLSEMTVNVHLSVAKNSRITQNQTTEVTVHTGSNIIRAEERHEDLHASIDLVCDKLMRQLRKYKEKRQAKAHKHDKIAAAVSEEFTPSDLLENRTPELPKDVVRTKYFAMPPMSVEEALEHLHLVGHDFYMFHNVATNEINVIYERNHGGYGLLQPRSGGDRSLGK